MDVARPGTPAASQRPDMPRWLPGSAVAAAAALLAWGIHLVVPAIPLLTAAVALGVVVGQLPAARGALTGVLAPGLSLSAKRLMRIGIVLLGLKLSFADIAGLGWVSIATTVAIVLVTFVGTLWLGRLARLPGRQPLLIATGFSICGVSAIGAMSAVVRSKDEEAAVPVALVTLCGTLAIGVLPLLWHPLGLDALQFGHWAGASVHDVGQVVATAQIAGQAALATAIVVKLTRVVMLAPMVAMAGVVEHRRSMRGLGSHEGTGAEGTGTAVATSPDGTNEPTDAAAKRPPIVPLFVAGFLAAALLRTLVVLPDPVLDAADTAQTALLAMALFGLGTAVRLRTLVGTGWRALLVGLISWVLIAVLSFGAVQIS